MKRILGIVSVLLLWCGSVMAQPGGPGWTETVVADGIKYYTFTGVESISGAPQEIFIIDWDTTNPSYALSYTWTADRCVTSDAFRTKNAVVAMNACYEPESVVIKERGRYYSLMPRDTVMETPVPNWKSEGAIYVDATGRNINIAFSGKGKTIEEQRAFYASSPWENIFTSSPMLIDNYSPVGAFFVDSTLTAEQLTTYNYEDPIRHQGVRHPRSAVALTADHHFLMITVDGRKAGISEGMTARELTRFIEHNFRPQYALNMDGGGSTTMCVRGQGDPRTHVVNYPTGNKKHDHAGERRLFTHFCIVEVPQAPKPQVVDEVRSNPVLAAGLDCIYDFSPKVATPAPKGYEPIYVAHYGRHGSRYAYTAKTYTLPLEMLREAAQTNNLTERGQKLLADLEAFWAEGQYKVGDLAPLGWEQHARIAREMVKNFPSAFKAGSRVDACSSASVRSIMSMASCCISIAKEAPTTQIYEHQGVLDVQATRPNTGKNPFRYVGPATFFPFPESSEEFFLRKFPEWKQPLARLFKDPEAGLGGRNAFDVFFHYYMLVVGMNSLPDEEKIDIDGLLTNDELATLWEIDNYERFREYLPYRTPCSSIVDDIVAKADARLAAGERGADLRFGHDHVVMSLLMIMDVDGFGIVPENADDLANYFKTFRSPMATNLQFVFFAPVKDKTAPVLVKLLHNGEEVRLGKLPTVKGPYYEWPALREYLRARTNLFVNRK